MSKSSRNDENWYFLVVVFYVLLFLLILIWASGCEEKDRVTQVFQDRNNVCFGANGYIQGELACRIMAGLERDDQVFFCFPYQMFRNNCDWAEAHEWVDICNQPMNSHSYRFETVFCHKIQNKYMRQWWLDIY